MIIHCWTTWLDVYSIILNVTLGDKLEGLHHLAGLQKKLKDVFGYFARHFATTILTMISNLKMDASMHSYDINNWVGQVWNNSKLTDLEAKEVTL